MMRRLMMTSLAALLLSGCGGESYPVPATQAYQSLAGLGTSNVTPLLGVLQPVTVSFSAVPADNAVRWAFTHDGDNLAQIIAKVDPDGDASSNVTVEYVDGDAPGDKWRNTQARSLIESGVMRLVTEAVDAKLDNRPFDQAVRDSVERGIISVSAGAMMNDANDSMNDYVAKKKKEKAEEANAYVPNPQDASRPSMNLSQSSSNAR